MSAPISLCLEDLQATADTVRYLACVALAADTPGLAVDRQGRVVWKMPADAALELVGLEDGRLGVRLAADAPPALVERSGRQLELPAGRFVPLVDQDVLLFAGQRLRLVVHGAAATVQPPRLVDLAGSAPTPSSADEAGSRFGDLSVLDHPPEPLLPEDMESEPDEENLVDLEPGEVDLPDLDLDDVATESTAAVTPPATAKEAPAPVAVRSHPPSPTPPFRPGEVEAFRRWAEELIEAVVHHHAGRVAQGRRSRDLFRRLRPELDVVRETLEREAPPNLTWMVGDAFSRALVSVLAQGDEGALGGP